MPPFPTSPDEGRGAFLQAIVDALPLAVFAKDYATGVGVFVAWNKRAEELWGLASADVLGRSDFDFFPAEQAEFFLAKDRETLDSGQLVYIAQEPVDSPTVGRRFVRTWKVPLTFGARPYLLGLSLDITEQLGTDRALAESREQLNVVFEVCPVPMLMIAADGRVSAANASANAAFHVGTHGLQGDMLSELVPRGLPLEYSDSDDKMRFPDAGDVTVRRPDGSVFRAEVGLARLSDGPDRSTLAVVHDVTEREDRMRRLRISNADLEQFAHVASHDLREPLRVVASYSELLARQAGDKLDDKERRYLHHILDGSQRMQRLVTDLLTYSRLTTEAKAREWVDSQAVLDGALLDLSVAIAEAGARIDVAPLPMVVADGQQLRRVFQNLVANAITYRRAEAPRVEVSVSEIDGGWQFAVRDNGIGIAEEHFDRIFHMFKRLHGPSDFRGTGVGLAIVSKVVERHGGRIWVKSHEGAGSTFYFTLVTAHEGG